MPKNLSKRFLTRTMNKCMNDKLLLGCLRIVLNISKPELRLCVLTKINLRYKAKTYERYSSLFCLMQLLMSNSLKESNIENRRVSFRIISVLPSK